MENTQLSVRPGEEAWEGVTFPVWVCAECQVEFCL